MTISNEQRLARKNSIGGSDAPIIANVSPWKTRLQLFLEKTSEEPPPFLTTLPMQIGTALEPVIINEFGVRTGQEVTAFEQTLFHPSYPMMTGHIDGAIIENGQPVAGVESKWVGRITDEWGETGTDHVPAHVMLQCVHYMMVTGWQSWNVAALFGGTEFRWYEIQRNDVLIDALLKMELEFWQMIQARTPPPITNPIDARLLYKQDDGSSVIADTKTALAFFELQNLKLQRDSLESEIDEKTAEIQHFMGEHSTLTDQAGRILATWKTAKPATRIDTKALKENAPDIYRQFSVTGEPARRFLLKQQKGV